VILESCSILGLVVSRVKVSVVRNRRVNERTRSVGIVEDGDVDGDFRSSTSSDVGSESSVKMVRKKHQYSLKAERRGRRRGTARRVA